MYHRVMLTSRRAFTANPRRIKNQESLTAY